MSKLNGAQYIDLAYSTAHAFIKKNPSLSYMREDLCSEAALGMLEGCNEWDPTLTEMKSTTYLVHRAQQQMLNYCTRNEFRYTRIHKLEDVYEQEVSIDPDAESWEDLVPGQVLDMVAALSRLDPEIQEWAEDLAVHGMRKCSRELWHCNWNESLRRREEVLQAIENIGELPY